MESRYIVIGDVHGNYKALEKLLNKVHIFRSRYNSYEWISVDGYKAVLLGDLNDYYINNPSFSSLKAIQIGMELCCSGIGIVLHSNHQENLIQYLNNSYKFKLKSGLQQTVKELELLDSKNLELIKEWLSTRPLTYSFDIKGKVYSCVHAYFPNTNLLKTDPLLYKNLCINGLTNDKGRRINWWNYPALIDTERTVLCGHYHVVIHQPHVVVIDGNCGSYSKGMLFGYLPHKCKYIRV